MGIRFLCRHCRAALNVKSSQAGQQGDCPQCGQAVEVPFVELGKNHAEHPSGRGSKAGSVFDVDNQITEAGLSPAVQLDTGLELAKFSVSEASPVRTSPIPHRPLNDDPTELFLLDKPLPPSTMGKIDPILEEPAKVWYFRSKTIGEKGPLKAKTMQAELDNGNVTIGCIVWREDWEDWQPAEAVFPKLVALLEARQSKRLMREAHSMIPDELNPYSAMRRRQRRVRVLGVIAIVAGLLIISGLVYFLNRLMVD